MHAYKQLSIKHGFDNYISDITMLHRVCNQATGYASQHIWCLSQARINLEGSARKDIQYKNSGDGRDGGCN